MLSWQNFWKRCALVVGGAVEEVGGGLFDERELLVAGDAEVAPGRRCRAGPSMRSQAIQPCSARISRQMRIGLPAKAESAE